MRLAGLAAAALAAGVGAAKAQDSGLVLDEITVTAAARDSRPLLDTPAAATVIEGDALAVRQATNYQELIGDAPGLTIFGGPRPIAQEPNIRGFSDDQIVLRFDGGRMNFNDAHRGRFFIDPDIIQRVEIIRGGGSTLYGSGALGGVIAPRPRTSMTFSPTATAGAAGSPRAGRRTATSARRRPPSSAGRAPSTPSASSAGGRWAPA